MGFIKLLSKQQLLLHRNMHQLRELYEIMVNVALFDKH